MKRITNQLIKKRIQLIKLNKEIHTISQQIAIKNCPLNIGDDIFYTIDNREWKGRVDEIFYETNFNTYFPECKAEIWWVVRVNRCYKRSNKLTEYFPIISENTHEQKIDLWKERTRSSNDDFFSTIIF